MFLGLKWNSCETYFCLAWKIWSDMFATVRHELLISLTYWGRDKWPPFHRRNFQMHFLEWKLLNFKWYYIVMCYMCYVIKSSDNGMAPNKRHAIIWANDGVVYWLTQPQWVKYQYQQWVYDTFIAGLWTAWGVYLVSQANALQCGTW